MKFVQNKNLQLIVLPVTLIFFVWVMFQSGLLNLWVFDEEYGHGILVLATLIYLLYERRHSLEGEEVKSWTWLGGVLGLISVILFIVGYASGISVISKYSVWIFAVAATFSFGGKELFKKLIVPLAILFLLIPLPAPLGPMLTSEFQLISSKLAVWVIRLFGGVVFLEGNVIDMGSVQLLVAEACAGLRYLFPLMSIGAIVAYVLNAHLWIRWAIFFVTIPITIFLNSFRIAFTSLLVERWGDQHTEGFLHFFEGWVVFIFALISLFVIAWVLLRFQYGKGLISKAFYMGGSSVNTLGKKTSIWSGYTSSVTLLMLYFCVTVFSTYLLANRSQPEIIRTPLSQFPVRLDDWRGVESRLDSTVEAVAGANDYYLGDFISEENDAVNVYISYYSDQKHGQIPHSPKVCIPSAGWNIKSNNSALLKNNDGNTFKVNRLVIEKDGHVTVAYYWLKQAEKIYTNELYARLDLIRIALEENRTDGALIRIVTHLKSGEDEVDADNRLKVVSQSVIGHLSKFVPD